MIPFARVLKYGNVLPPPVSIVSTHLGSQSFFALSSDGTLYCTGTNDYGQLGLGDKVTRNVWVKCNEGVDAVYTGMNAGVVIIRKGNSLYLSGLNTLSTGVDNATYLTFTMFVEDISTIYEFSDCYIKDIQVNNSSMMLLMGRTSNTSYGVLYSQGKGATLGQGATTQVLTLTAVSSAPRTILQISASASNCMATTTNGAIIGVGNNSFKQLTNTTTTTYNTYVSSGTTTSQNVHCGDYVVYAVKTDGIYVRGNSVNGTINDFTKVLSFSTDLVSARDMVFTINTRGAVCNLKNITGVAEGLYVVGQKYDVTGVVGSAAAFTKVYDDQFSTMQGGFNHYIYKNDSGFYISGEKTQFLSGQDATSALRPMRLP